MVEPSMKSCVGSPWTPVSELSPMISEVNCGRSVCEPEETFPLSRRKTVMDWSASFAMVMVRSAEQSSVNLSPQPYWT